MSPRLVAVSMALLLSACEPRIGSERPDDGLLAFDGGIDAADLGSAEAGPDAASMDGDAEGPADLGRADLGFGGDGAVNTEDCWPDEHPESGRTYTDPRGTASVSTSGPRCQRRYRLESTAPRRRGPAAPRTIEEDADRPVLRTGHLLFDATYALALAEAKAASVSQIRDDAFNDGLEIDCGSAGCFETGASWRYVWSRDTGYALHLGLAFFDPPRGANSLLFKVSDPRGGGSPELVQDTGTGGSWPISTDRVVLAMGARSLLPWLDDAERGPFVDRFYEALRNTVARDRSSVFDPEDGLYRGEQSFLDWREQTYPLWASGELVHIGLSKSLSTNVVHLEALRFLAQLAAERGDLSLAAESSVRANDLSAAIAARFWRESEGLPSSFIPTTLDPAAVHRYDLLGLSLAITSGVLSAEQARTALSAYPTLPFGPPVSWPQQQLTPIYHNRAIWPFVTAFGARAAKASGHAAFATHALVSLFSSAALFQSNLENLEMVSGLSHVDDGAYSGPVVNSERQLWSVGGYLGAVNEVLFGIEVETNGLRVDPFVPKALRAALFPDSSVLRLSGFPIRGRRIDLSVRLPPLGAEREGAYRVRSRRLNGIEIATEHTPFSVFDDGDLLEIELEEGPPAAAVPRREVSNLGDYRELFGPRTPVIDLVGNTPNGVLVHWQGAGEAPPDIEFWLHRNGVAIAGPLGGNVVEYLDTSAGADGRVPCYTVESRFLISGNASQHAKPVCAFPAVDSVQSIYAGSFEAVGGTLVDQFGWLHYQGWGDPGHELVIPNLQPRQSGSHLIQIVGSNGAGPRETGITAGVKRLRVFEVDGGGLVAEGLVFLPHTGGWDQWREGSFVSAHLQAGRRYRVVLDDASWARNMSALAHFEAYTGGLGGRSGPFFRFNVSEIRVIPVDIP